MSDKWAWGQCVGIESFAGFMRKSQAHVPLITHHSLLVTRYLMATAALVGPVKGIT